MVAKCTKLENWGKLNEVIAGIADREPARLKCLKNSTGCQLTLDGELIGLHTYDYYVMLVSESSAWRKVVANVMEEILRPIKKAKLLGCYRQSLPVLYQFGLRVFPENFHERWLFMMQFYYDFAGQREDLEKLEAEKIIEQFKKENRTA